MQPEVVEEKRCYNCGNKHANSDGIGLWCNSTNMPVHAFNSCGAWASMFAPVTLPEVKPIQEVEVEIVNELPPAPIVETNSMPRITIVGNGCTTVEIGDNTYYSCMVEDGITLTVLNDTVDAQELFSDFKRWWKKYAAKQK